MTQKKLLCLSDFALCSSAKGGQDATVDSNCCPVISDISVSGHCWLRLSLLELCVKQEHVGAEVLVVSAMSAAYLILEYMSTWVL